MSKEGYKLAPSAHRFFLLVAQHLKVFIAQDDALFANGKEQLFGFGYIMYLAQLINHGRVHGHFVLCEPVGYQLFARLLCLAVIATQDGLYLAFGFGR